MVLKKKVTCCTLVDLYIIIICQCVLIYYSYYGSFGSNDFLSEFEVFTIKS